MGVTVQEPTGYVSQKRRQEADMDEQVVVFNLGEEFYGVDISRVQEIIRWQGIARVPKAPYFVEGVINLRGKVIPVVDLRRSFELEPAPHDKERRIVVVDILGSTVGLIVDGVSEVLDVPASSVEPPSPVVVTTDSTYLRGIARFEDRLILLLNLERILTVESLAGVDDRPPETLTGQAGIHYNFLCE